MKLGSPLILANTSPARNENCATDKTSLLNELPARKIKAGIIFQHQRHINGALDKRPLASKPGSLGQHTCTSPPQRSDPRILPYFSCLPNHSKTQQPQEKENIPYLNTLKSKPNLQI